MRVVFQCNSPRADCHDESNWLGMTADSQSLGEADSTASRAVAEALLRVERTSSLGILPLSPGRGGVADLPPYGLSAGNLTFLANIWYRCSV
jgi:hypothetical protein